jgi:hypothetical protein
MGTLPSSERSAQFRRTVRRYTPDGTERVINMPVHYLIVRTCCQGCPLKEHWDRCNVMNIYYDLTELQMGCEVLRIPYCLDNRLTGGGKAVSPTHRLRSSSQKHFSASGTHLY